MSGAISLLTPLLLIASGSLGIAGEQRASNVLLVVFLGWGGRGLLDSLAGRRS